MKKYFYFLLLFLLFACAKKEEKTFTVMQLNIWQEGTMVPGGYQGIVDEVARLKPDFVTFSEVRNYKKSRFCDRIVQSLMEKGETYYSFYSYDSGLLSRYPIKDSVVVFPENGDHGSIYKMITSIHGQDIAVYTAHLDYQNCAYYMPRGYHGSTWAEIPNVADVDTLLAMNVASQRDDAIALFMKEADKDIANGVPVLIGGDFNEPSHLDWIEANKNLYEHNGVVIPWTVSVMLEKDGFIDTYREKFPDPVTHPGFTYPSDNPLKEPGKLTWAPKSDERERIDFIYYKGNQLALKDIVVYGPATSIAYNERVKEETQDPFMEPVYTWGSDHKGVIATFTIK